MARKKQTKGRRMTDDELAAAVRNQLSSSQGIYDGTEVSRSREKAMEYYLGEPYGNEMDGQSTVRTREVMETIEWTKPELMKIFASGQDTVRFEPFDASDVAQAEQETDYINYIFNKRNPGFKILYTWITDGLLQKNGIVKVWNDYDKEKVREDYKGLTELEYQMLVAHPDVEIVEYEVEEFIDEATQQPMVSYEVGIVRDGPQKGIQIENIPPEEFVIQKGAKDIQSSNFCAHITKKTISELNAMGYATDGLSEGDFSWDLFSAEKIARHKKDGQYEDIGSNDHPDPTMREVWLVEAYMRCDNNGDGVAEIMKVCMVGDTVLEKEEVDCMPFASWSPILIPHNWNGLSMADLVMDLQLIQSQLMRNILNNQYLTNNGRYLVLDGQANVDDLLTSRAHGVVRQKVPGAVQRLDTPQLGASAFQMLDWVNRMVEKRTGISERQQGIDQNALAANQAASAVNQLMTAAQQRIELIARVFAETGLTDLFKLIHKLVIQSDSQREIVKLRGKYVEVDPSEWRERNNTTVVVGLGNGSKDNEIMQLGMLLQHQQQIASNPAFAPIVSKDNVYNILEDMVAVYNKANAGRYFLDPNSEKSQKFQQETQQAQKAQQEEQQKLMQAQLALEERKVKVQEAELELKRQEIGMKGQQSQQELSQKDRHHDDKIALDSAELELEYELEKTQGRGVSLGGS